MYIIYTLYIGIYIYNKCIVNILHIYLLWYRIIYNRRPWRAWRTSRSRTSVSGTWCTTTAASPGSRVPYSMDKMNRGSNRKSNRKSMKKNGKPWKTMEKHGKSMEIDVLRQVRGSAPGALLVYEPLGDQRQLYGGVGSRFRSRFIPRV